MRERFRDELTAVWYALQQLDNSSAHAKRIDAKQKISKSYYLFNKHRISFFNNPLLQSYGAYEAPIVDQTEIESLIREHVNSKRADEAPINAAYTPVENSRPLCIGEQRIFALRTDFILALGIKNSDTELGNIDIYNITNPMLHRYINKGLRSGHESLAMPEGDYDGSVYYAGWLYQHKEHIEIFLASGHYHSPGLGLLQKQLLEVYISEKLTDAFGQQDVVFIDWDGTMSDVFPAFMRGILLKSAGRVYVAESLCEIKNTISREVSASTCSYG